MSQQNEIQLHQNQTIRTAWDEQAQEWCFSVVDVIKAITKQPDQRHAGKYWSVLKLRLQKEGAQLTTLCSQLKMTASDGRKRLTDVANFRQILRIIQVVPSPKAEPFKQWLAYAGQERVLDLIDPERNVARAVELFFRKGYDRAWIEERLQSAQVRTPNGITNEPNAPECQTLMTEIFSDIFDTECSCAGVENRTQCVRDQMSLLELALEVLGK